MMKGDYVSYYNFLNYRLQSTYLDSKRSGFVLFIYFLAEYITAPFFLKIKSLLLRIPIKCTLELHPPLVTVSSSGQKALWIVLGTA